MTHGRGRRGNMRVEWVASSLALYLGTCCVQHYYCWRAHLGCQQSTELTPRQFKWTGPFRWKTKSGFCACTITFRTFYTNRWVETHFQKQKCSRPVFKAFALWMKLKIVLFIHQLMHQWVVLKNSIKIYIKTAPTCFGVTVTPSRSALICAY